LSAPLEVTVGDIQRLADEPLRELIKRLCLAELSDARLPNSAVRAGGHQDASDGGIDVRVALAGAPAGLDFIPKGQTGLQAKAESMPPSKVSGEMLDRGVLKPAIRELLTRGGAYVLVSSKDSCTEKMLVQRVAAMRKVVGDAGLPADVALDFLGADRIADWTNRHPGVALWLREHLDGPSHGWRGYGAWTAASAAEGFLVDEQPRVEAPGEQGTRQLNIAQTLAELRAKLRDPGSAIRLVGLSGTGKTRLVQALFEAGFDAEHLPAHLAIYADAGEALQPPPVEMLRRLATQARPVVLVIDNCNPETHRALQTALSIRAGRVSLLTVEYDIDGGEAEEADVYRLGVTTPELLDRLLAQRYPALGSGVRQQIVNLSEGNLRVALALASAVRRTGRLNGLSDAGLFRRLFWQGRQPDASLEHAARVMALVYSFKAEESNVPEAEQEITRLARLAGCSSAELRRHLGTLLDRGLAQRRGPWRAILPHALANHLAARGLGAVSGEALWCQLRPHERLSLSFARRLSSLHDSQDARDLVERWFREAPGMAIFNEHSMQGREVFRRLAPVRPDLALARLEELTAVEGQGLLGEAWIFCRDDAIRSAKHLAYPAADFARAAEVLVRLAVHGSTAEPEGRTPSMPRPLEMLFRPLASGTEATLIQRLALLAALLDAPDPDRQYLGLAGLRTVLSARWSGSVPETFGAWVRGPGWQPRTTEEWEAWYVGVLAFVQERLASPAGRVLELADLVSRALPGLVEVPRLGVHLESFVSAQRDRPVARLLWRGVVVALLQSPRHAQSTDGAARVEMLRRLEASIRPSTLKDHVEALMLVPYHDPLDVLTQESHEQHLSETPEARGLQALTLERLAGELAMRLEASDELVPWLVSLRSPHAMALGEHLANAVTAWPACWKLLKDAFRQADPQQLDAGLLLGFFNALYRRDGTLAEAVLVDVAADPGLLQLGVELHALHLVTEVGVERLMAIARSGAVAAERFGVLRFGGVLDGLAPASHAKLLRVVSELPNGVRVAIELHRMRLHGLNSRNADVDDEARKLFAELLLKVDASFVDERDWYGVSDLVAPALSGQQGREVAVHLCAVLLARSDEFALGHPQEVVAGQLFAGQPVVTLDAFGPDADDQEGDSLKDWWLLNERHGHPVRQLADGVLLAWAAVDAERRGPWLAARIKVFADKPERGFSPLALALLQRAPDRTRILASFESGVPPNSWSGSYAAAAQPFVAGLSALLLADEPDVAVWAKTRLQRIEERIADWDKAGRQSAQGFE